MLQTIHKLYTNPTSRRSKPYTASVRETIHEAEHKPYILCWTRISRMEFRTRKVRKEWMVRKKRKVRKEWMVRKKRKVRIVRDVCNERYVRYERKTGNGNRRWRASSLPPSLPLFDSLSLPISFRLLVILSRLLVTLSRRFVTPARRPKIQQFWVIFQRFDINIFNLSEHFSPPSFAYSAHNFSLPSPNLN